MGAFLPSHSGRRGHIWTRSLKAHSPLVSQHSSLRSQEGFSEHTCRHRSPASG